MKQKLYPFSLQKHAHDIEFRKNRIWCEMRDMEMGDVPWNDALYDKMSTLLDELRDLLTAVLNSRDGRISYLTGQQIGLAKETVLWATSVREESMAKAQEKREIKLVKRNAWMER